MAFHVNESRASGAVRISMVLGLVLAVAAAFGQPDPGQPRNAPAPTIGAETGKVLNAAIELLQAGKAEEAQNAVARLDLAKLSPYERSKVEQILFNIAFAQERYADAEQHLRNAIDAGGLNPQEISQAALPGGANPHDSGAMARRRRGSRGVVRDGGQSDRLGLLPAGGGLLPAGRLRARAAARAAGRRPHERAARKLDLDAPRAAADETSSTRTRSRCCRSSSRSRPGKRPIGCSCPPSTASSTITRTRSARCRAPTASAC